MKCRGPQIERTWTVQCEAMNAETAEDLVKARKVETGMIAYNVEMRWR
jgi:hypothetical protein